MAVVSLVSQKGGVGKSTLTRAVAVEAARGGLTVRIADLDVGQGSQVDWHRDRLAAGLTPAPQVQLHPSLADALSHAASVDLLLLDGPARADRDTLALAKTSDLVVLPTGASLDDLRPAVRAANGLAKGGIPVSRLLFVLSRIATDAEAEAARAYLTEAGYRVAIGYLAEKPGYRTAQNSGRAVTEASYQTLRSGAEAVVQAIIDSLPED